MCTWLQEDAARCYDQAELWIALRSGAPLASLRLNHPLRYASERGLLACTGGVGAAAPLSCLAASGALQGKQCLLLPRDTRPTLRVPAAARTRRSPTCCSTWLACNARDAWDWLAKEHNAAGGQRTITEFLRRPTGEAQQR